MKAHRIQNPNKDNQCNDHIVSLKWANILNLFEIITSSTTSQDWITRWQRETSTWWWTSTTGCTGHLSPIFSGFTHQARTWSEGLSPFKLGSLGFLWFPPFSSTMFSGFIHHIIHHFHPPCSLVLPAIPTPGQRGSVLLIGLLGFWRAGIRDIHLTWERIRQTLFLVLLSRALRKKDLSVSNKGDNWNPF